MPASAFYKFNVFVLGLGTGVYELQAAGQTLKVYLSNATPSASADTIKADLAEIAAGNGYTAGGEDVQNDYTEAAGVATLTGSSVAITGAGGSIGPFRYAVLYVDDAGPPVNPLIGWWDYGSEVPINDGQTLNITIGASILTVTQT